MKVLHICVALMLSPAIAHNLRSDFKDAVGVERISSAGSCDWMPCIDSDSVCSDFECGKCGTNGFCNATADVPDILNDFEDVIEPTSA